ncbi:prolyl oligopeptidase family serine peptidase [Fulvivirgaceae bacterium BMA10]|uniref:prolyl oligopeptidase n=1 Tax=Splendidivirga corallicola TaxID=3051826 RepID=A0ABT8KK13_9BACT|nr:prolyl oligopeptidase family serine peptidase [Fulvivirgaceae bacterium BMA10]
MIPQHTQIKVLPIILIILAVIFSTAFYKDKLEYPKAQRTDHKDVYHGKTIYDPYRWMEAMNDTVTQNWVKAQENLLTKYLDQSTVERIQRRLSDLGKTGKAYGPPTKRGHRYFYTIADPQYVQSRLFRQDGLQGKKELLFDPNVLFKDDNNRVRTYSFDPEGKLMAINYAEGQSRWGWMKIMHIENGEFEEEELTGIGTTAIAWSPDKKGFYYVKYGDTGELNSGGEVKSEICFHKIGSPQSADQTLAINPTSPDQLYSLKISPDSKYLIITIFKGSGNKSMIYYKDLTSQNNEVKALIEKNENSYTYLGSKGKRFWFYTDRSAPNGKIISMRIDQPQPENWKTIVEESDAVMAGGSSAGGNAISMITDYLVVLVRKDTRSFIRSYDLEGVLKNELAVNTGWIGSGIAGNYVDPEAWFTLNTFTEPSTVYRLDLKTGRHEPFVKRKLLIDQEDYVTKHVFYKSKDGTQVPLFIAHKKNISLSGNNPLFMYGYGFGGWVAVPWYQPHMLAWLDMGGVYAMPGIRGGGEYGEEWRKAGILLNRQNAIDDYVAAAEWLVKEGYTSSKKIVANGWSASGSLAATAVMQRPELFGVGMIGIPTLDMLRYREHTPFKNWTRGFGSPDIPEEFDALYAYSPYHNIKKGKCYPPMLITVGEKDQVAPPFHGYKFVAAMQYNQPCNEPVLLKTIWSAGHSFGVSSQQTYETQAQELAFLSKVLDINISENF